MMLFSFWIILNVFDFFHVLQPLNAEPDIKGHFNSLLHALLYPLLLALLYPLLHALLYPLLNSLVYALCMPCCMPCSMPSFLSRSAIVTMTDSPFSSVGACIAGYDRLWLFHPVGFTDRFKPRRGGIIIARHCKKKQSEPRRGDIVLDCRIIIMSPLRGSRGVVKLVL